MNEIISIQNKGLDELINKVKTLKGPEGIRAKSVANAWTQDTVNMLIQKPYPPELPGQVYIRTGNLAAEWHSIGNITAAKWSFVNKSGYAPFVIGEDPAWMHAGRWWEALPTIEAEIPKLLNRFKSWIERIWSA